MEVYIENIYQLVSLTCLLLVKIAFTSTVFIARALLIPDSNGIANKLFF